MKKSLVHRWSIEAASIEFLRPVAIEGQSALSLALFLPFSIVGMVTGALLRSEMGGLACTLQMPWSCRTANGIPLVKISDGESAHAEFAKAVVTQTLIATAPNQDGKTLHGIWVESLEGQRMLCLTSGDGANPRLHILHAGLKALGLEVTRIQHAPHQHLPSSTRYESVVQSHALQPYRLVLVQLSGKEVLTGESDHHAEILSALMSRTARGAKRPPVSCMHIEARAHAWHKMWMPRFCDLAFVKV